MSKRTHWLPFLALATLIAGYLTGLDVFELRAEEPRRALVAMEMLFQGNLWMPTIHGEPYYNKPPLYNWVMAGFFTIFQSFEEWVVRLPGVLSYLLLAYLHFRWVKRWGSEQLAIVSAAGLLCVGDILFYAAVNAGEIDLFFALLTWAQIASVFHFLQKKHWPALWLSTGVLTALGVLTKGLPSLVFLGLTLLGYSFYTRRWRWLFTVWSMLGGMVFLLLAGGYFALYAQFGDVELYLSKLVSEASEKSFGFQRLLGHVLEFPLTLWLKLLPVSLLLLLLYKHPTVRRPGHHHPLLAFCAVFVLVNLPLYWLSPEVRIRYLYPFWPFICTLLAWIGVSHPRFRMQTLWVIVLIIGLLRLTYSFVGMPIQRKGYDRMVVEQNTRVIHRLAGGQPIGLIGETKRDTVHPGLGPFQLPVREMRRLPRVPYQLPYYLGRINREVMPYVAQPESGQYYILFEDDPLAEKQQPLFTFREYVFGKNLWLVQWADAVEE